MKEVLISTCEKTFISDVIASNQVPIHFSAVGPALLTPRFII